MTNNIPTGWIKTTLGEVVETNISSIGKDFEFDEIVYLDTGSITENRIDSLQKYNVSEAPSRAKRLVKENDIVYSTVRPNQKHFGFIESPKENLVVSTGFTVVSVVYNKADSRFLYYFLTQDQITNILQQIAEHSTSTYPSIRSEHIENLDILLPPLPEQQAIASVLSAFDDKIELLREQNKTLEQIGQTVFQEWFGKYSPDRPEELPEGWRVCELSELFSFVKGKKPIETSELQQDGFIPQILINTFNGEKTIFANPKNTIISTIDDLLMVMDGASSGRIEFGFPGIIGSTLALLKIEKPIKSILYYFLKLKEKDIQEKTVGSAIPHTDKNMVYNYKLILPKKLSNVIELDKMFLVLRGKIILNRFQIQSLSRTRDELLPRLMSGEVRVK